MTHASLSGLLLIALLSICGVSSAQDSSTSSQDLEAAVQAKPSSEERPKFEIEFVVFAYNAFDPADEDLGRERDRLMSKGDQEWSPKPPVQFEMLQPADLTLNAACDKLKRLNAYTVLVHGGWVQEGLPEEDAPEIDMSIFGEPSVSGTLRFYVSRYAHVTAAIDYHASTEKGLTLRTASPDTPEASTSSPRRFELRQTRRLRSGELHYFDHPAFGLLVTVRRHAEAHENVAGTGANSERTARPAA